VVIEGVNIVRRHLKRGRARQAGIVEMEAPLHVSNVMVWCSNHNGPARVGFRSDAEGNKERYCKQCDAALPKPRPAEKKRS
jgi:large subunit ribosomal protein L24